MHPLKDQREGVKYGRDVKYGVTPARPQVGKLVVACYWSAVTVQNPDKLYVLVSSAFPTTRRGYDLYGVESDVKPQIKSIKNNRMDRRNYHTYQKEFFRQWQCGSESFWENILHIGKAS